MGTLINVCVNFYGKNIFSNQEGAKWISFSCWKKNKLYYTIQNWISSCLVNFVEDFFFLFFFYFTYVEGMWKSGWPSEYKACLLIKQAWVQAWLAANIWPAIIWSLQGKAMGNHPREKISQENYSGGDTIHCNRRRSESQTLEEEEVCGTE